MKRLLCLLLSCVLAGSLCACGSTSASSAASAASSGPKPETDEFYAMDTVMDLTAYGDGAKAALSAAQTQIETLESLLSRTKADSEVSAINTAGGAAVSVAPSVAQLLSAAVEYSAATGGAFDITIAPVVSAWGFTTDSYQVPSQEKLDTLLPLVDYTRIKVRNAADGAGAQVSLGAGQSIDLGGIAKGYTSDTVEGIFRENGVDSGMISLGGNVYVRGSKPDGSAWRVAVQDPANSQGYVGILSLTNAFAVTSGGYQRYFEQDGKRYHHIIDPSTGYPAESGLTSVTIVAAANSDADSDTVTPGAGTMCDAFSTALFVMGADKAAAFWRSGAYAFDMVLVTDDGRVLVTKGIADQFEQSKGSNYAYEVIR